MLGIIGGFSGLVWGVLGLLLGSYESFRQDVSLLESFYSADDRIRDTEIYSGRFIKKNIDYKGNLQAELQNRTRYTYSYWSYAKANFIRNFFCCCACKQRLNRLKLHM